MKKILFIIRYIKYLFKAKNKHTAHSPFLYDFITNVLNKKSDDENCKKIEKLRRHLCKSEKKIKITDFGLSKITNNSLKSKSDRNFLWTSFSNSTLILYIISSNEFNVNDDTE